MAPEKDQLSKQDLFILMDSYKNNIQLNTTLLEQQKQMLILHDKIIEKQKETCDMIDGLVQKIGKCSETISNNQLTLSTNQTALSTDLASFSSKLSGEHSSIISKIQMTYIGFGTIVVGIITLVITFIEKYRPIAEYISKLPMVK